MAPNEELARYINLKLAALGQPLCHHTADLEFLKTAGPLLRRLHQKEQLLGTHLSPVDARVQSFLDAYLSDVCPDGAARFPAITFNLDRPGMGRAVSLPARSDSFSSPYLHSYRVPQGVLHNPAADRRVTQGLFHIAEGGFPVPADKAAVPKRAFATLWSAALRPPAALMTLPYTSDQPDQAACFVSLLLRPLVCPATGRDPEKTMEVRFLAPASLVSNLDFVESIFGNAGDPALPENDAALDALHWTGHTGCVVLAPHLVGISKFSLGLPHVDDATERQRRDGMCWSSEDEPYNGGHPFKVTCRDSRGVMVTVIADNYYGYCKKEVKTQISFAANLFGICEEEHAGGALAFATYVIGQEFYANRTVSLRMVPFESAMQLLDGMVDRHPEGYAVDRRFPEIFYLPENAEFRVPQGTISWPHEGRTVTIPLRAKALYFLPNGYRLRLDKQQGGTQWRLVGSRPRGTLCHKPCTVSGGGKSEISKSIAAAILKGPVFVKDYHHDMDQVAEILEMDFSAIYRNRPPDGRARRPILSLDRSLGSVIQLLSPSPEYTEQHNRFVSALPQTIRQILFTVKRYYQPEWGDRWREHFTVDSINGYLGHELKFNNQKLVSNYLRVGYERDGTWRIFKLRPDFFPAEKVQVEDDITASVVLPRSALECLDPQYSNPSVKLVANCERFLFQRPDDAIHRGVDKQAEADIAGPDVFLSNFEPISLERARAMVDHTAEFDQYSAPIKRLFQEFVDRPSTGYIVSSACPRIVNGKRSTNPRYLQPRPDLVYPRDPYVAQIAARLARDIPADKPAWLPVNAVMAGRRNSPADPSIQLPPLAVYNPIHYQELPELFMDFVCSLTGKSPSTIGFGSEGALTKGPFNALPPVVDLNNALVSSILTGYAGFTTSAGFVGPQYRVDHDISLLLPEIWCRMQVKERAPEFLIDHGYLEKVSDFSFEGRTVLASRLGYRITSAFSDRFLGRIFELPGAVFTDEILRPETQHLGQFAEGVDAIVAAQARVALQYFEDGSVAAACPPLEALLHIMAHGHYRGMTAADEGVRQLFRRDTMLSSDWYRRRLRAKQSRDIALWTRHIDALAAAPELADRLAQARSQFDRVSSPAYLAELEGTIGTDPSLRHPWLSVPLRDYEAHMSADAVAQFAPLSEMFGEALQAFQPNSVAILGIAGGNGLERIDPAVTHRVYGIDVNPEYLAAARLRHPAIAGLELHCLDLAEQKLDLEPVDLVYAALIFEHAGIECCLDNALHLVAPGGVLSVVLQLPSTTEPAVGNSPIASIQAHRNSFHFVETDAFTQELESRGFHLIRSTTRPLPSGKAFWMAYFRK
ncbi:MAG TPA: methyltransferase domain-containing protein [Bryobacteraceae bacterium]|jgi:SAM-dependent methyltransferase|nr:methyltransferase domain-containing protein [Bryobacteraceae bacterium]